VSRDIWTIGHSTRTSDQLVAMLESFRVGVLVDVRRFPHSRRHPQFNTDELRRSLFQKKVKYEYLGDDLGGFRHPVPDSPHTGLRDSSFHGYADHMGSKGFRHGMSQLLSFAEQQRTAYMCSESNYKSCHRRMISDDLTLLRGYTVHHITDVDREISHEPTHVARVVEGGLLYAEKSLEDFHPKDEK
jgi:uncharacterized protein (DUF488 family)